MPLTRTFDLHDGAYYAWRDAGARGALLVHVDAHHDAAADPDWKTVDIGNFVRAAIRDGLVGDVRWVLPDPIWSDRDSRDRIVAEIAEIADGDVSDDAASIAARVENVPFRAGIWEAVVPRDAEVLLDIDVDYLFTAAYEERRSAPPLPLPWCWPDALASRIAAHALRPVLTTIASSITGGFTPFEWAHLARELALRLEVRLDAPALGCFERLRAAAVSRHAGDLDTAIAECRRAVEACPGEAAAFAQLSMALAASGHADDARAAFSRARQLDPALSHPFRSRGPYLLRRGRLDEAETAFRAALDLDPGDGGACAGLALVALERGRFAEAHDLAARALELGPEGLDAWRTIAAASAALGDTRAAIKARERALVLALHGAAPLGGPWATNPEGRLIDPGHWQDHAALAGLYAEMGDAAAAAAHRRMAAAGASVLPS